MRPVTSSSPRVKTFGYIADQVGHSTTRLTQDLSRYVFKDARTGAMRRLSAPKA